MVIFALVVLFLLYITLVTWRPPAVLAAMMSFYSFEQWAQVNSTFFAANPSFLNYTFGLVAIYAVCVSAIRFGPPLRHFPYVAWIIIALVLLSGVSYFWSINQIATYEVTRTSLPYIIVNALLIPMVIRSVNDLRVGLSTFVILGTPMAVLLLGSEMFGLTGRSLAFSQVVIDRYGREFEAGNALAIASFGGCLVIVSAFLSWHGVTRWVAIARWIIVALGLALVARSQSRGQMAAAVGVTMLLVVIPAFLGWRPKNFVLACVAGAVLVVALPWALTFSLAEDRFDLREWGQEFSETRIQFCLDLLAYWIEQGQPVYWLFGLGSGSAYHVIDIYPHVIPVELLVELGMVGLVLYLLLMIPLAFISVKLLFELRKDPNTQSLILILVGLWLFETILTLKQGSFLGSAQWMTMCILLAKSNIFIRQSRKARAISARRNALQQFIPSPVAAPMQMP